jgi:sugar transferase EpsL
MYKHYGKQTLDLVITITALIVLSPLIALLALMVRVKLGSPILFQQVRPGLDGQPFKLRKFRTMTDERDSSGHLLPDEVRLTPFGRFLRMTSLDELPGLFNVLAGEMSLVGPRPLLMEYLDRYTPEQMRRHEVKPGLTGWAQVNGRQEIVFSRRLALDVWYVDNLSFWLDMKILLITIPKVLGSRGVILGQEVAEVDDLGLSKGSRGLKLREEPDHDDTLDPPTTIRNLAIGEKG